MLYFLVGSRELDGGAMVTASHNPKAYTGVKLVREGALALSGRRRHRRRPGDDRRRPRRRRPAAARVEVVDVYEDFGRHALSVHRHDRR